MDQCTPRRMSLCEQTAWFRGHPIDRSVTRSSLLCERGHGDMRYA